MEAAHQAAMVDVAFAVRGSTLPRDHRHLLAAALQCTLPWLEHEERAGVHRLNLVHGEPGCDFVSGRTRLTLRIPRARAVQAQALAGVELDLAGHRLAVGDARQRELLAHGTLYAHLVAADVSDEAGFLAHMHAELATLGVQGRAICGRWQSVEADALVGCSLMLDGLAPEASLRILERGIGHHRRLGCGVFVPHRSAAAVGTPA